MKFIFALVFFCFSLCAQTLTNGSMVVTGTINHGTESGTGNTYVVGLSPAITAYSTGSRYSFIATHTNTATATLAINGLTAKTIKKQGSSTDLVSGDIANGMVVTVLYDGTVFQIQSVANAASGSSSPTGAAGGSLSGTYPNPGLATVNSSPGSYGSSTQTPIITVNAAGQVTSSSSVATSGVGSGSTTEYVVTTGYGAVGDAVMRNDAMMSAGSNILTSGTSVFPSGLAGKKIQVLQAGGGGTTLSGCSIANNSSVLTCSGGFSSTDGGRYIVIPGLGNIQIANYTSSTSVNLSSANTGSAISGVAGYLGYQTAEGTVSSRDSNTQLHLSFSATGQVINGQFVVGTDDTTAIQSAINAAGTAGGGVVRIPNPSSCPSGGTCGYFLSVPNITTAHNPSDLVIAYSNITLRGSEGMQVNLFCRGVVSVSSNTVAFGANPAAIVGNFLNIGDTDQAPGSNGANVHDVSVANLHFYGLNSGRTDNRAFDQYGTQNTQQLDGWIISAKGISIYGGTTNTNFEIRNVYIDHTKGEQIFSGGGIGKLVIANCTLDSSNADGVSVSANNLQMLDNLVTNQANSGVENGIMSFATTGVSSETVRHLYRGNIFRFMPAEAIALPGVDASTNAGTIEILGNYFDEVGVIRGVDTQAAIYATAQIGTGTAIAPSNIHIRDNTFHDCKQALQINNLAGVEVTNNSFIVDHYTLTSFENFTVPGNGIVLQGNHGYRTSYAQANSKTLQAVYVMNPFYGSASFVWTGIIAKNNIWQMPSTPHFLFAVSSGVGLSGVTSNYISFAGDVCQGCTYSSVDTGQWDLSSSTTIQPVGPVAVLINNSGSTATINKAKSEVGAELRVVNTTGGNVSFAADSNMAMQSTLALANNQEALFRFSDLLGKWILVSGR